MGSKLNSCFIAGPKGKIQGSILQSRSQPSIRLPWRIALPKPEAATGCTGDEEKLETNNKLCKNQLNLFAHFQGMAAYGLPQPITDTLAFLFRIPNKKPGI